MIRRAAWVIVGWSRALGPGTAAMMGFAAGVVSTFAGLAFLFLMARTVLPPMPAGRPFDRVAWMDPAREAEAARLEMADRIVAEGTMLGRTRPQVVADIGELSGGGYFKRYDLVYRLGTERRAIAVDSEWLVLKLGDDERVIEARIVTD